MAATYAFRAVSLPRLTFAWAALLLWAGIVVWKGFIAFLLDRWEKVPAVASARVVQVLDLDSITLDRKAALQGILLLPNAREVILASSRLLDDSDRLLLEIRARACDWPAVLFKRVIDIVVSVVGLVVLSPVYLVGMLAIRLDSPGPVLYRQTRVGQGGRPFELIKLRTMVDRAEEHTGPVLASRDDPRITRVGRWLRAFRIDELPQLINVLRGEMSIVGPRPERPEFVQEFRKTIEGYDLRHLVKPGITGLAQVHGDYDAAAEDKLRFDLVYVFLWSPVLELKIILQTIGIMLTPARGLGSRTRVAPPQARAVEPTTNGSAMAEVAAAVDGGGRRDGVQGEPAAIQGDRLSER
ncbi:exopolysaccharide biosynthesis polyprenyl glycosylphosphotransferase [Geochorda subterranea]|uniref:Exopolysaccharide biosynthesis polyprenyl glycosylphosphotransferase n=1 Tax=Geochorda subterranea TaxID=3109564 RepID=A0ABZ1BM12_9FIRM|nr:exopolysaccharide biosynthesis polyprenyl glycosylphosphotransferase [Limnochorda sp. LNt]WRP13724.1 exopolysaccharide biosynthesis polyprenyl glycosylphosphotransferase [Limnochorda sp. LNt]